MVVALAIAVVTPRLLPSGSLNPVTPPGRVLQAPGGGFEVVVQAGWTQLRQDRMILTPGGDNGSGIVLRPKRRAANTTVAVYTAILSPAQYPGTEPSATPYRRSPPTGPPSGWTTPAAPSAGGVGGTSSRRPGRSPTP